MNWNDLRYALALYRHSTVKAAAESMSVEPTTVSRHVKELGRHLGDELFTSAGQKWVPTALGRRLAELAVSFQAEENLLIQRIKNQERKYTISGPEFILSDYLAPQLRALTGNQKEAFPDLIEGKHLSLAYGEVDLCLTFVLPKKGRLVSSKVLDVKYMLFHAGASNPSGWIELEDDYEGAWDPASQMFGTEPKFKATSVETAKAIGASTGLAFLAPVATMANAIGFRVLPNFKPIERALWCSYHEERRFEKALQALKERTKSVLKARNEIDCGEMQSINSGVALKTKLSA